MTNPSDESLSSAPAPAAPGGSVWEDLIDIFYAPTKVFERRRDGRFWVSLLVLIVMTIVLYFATKPYLQAMFDVIWAQSEEKMRKNPRMTEEMLSKARNGMETWGWVTLVFVTPIGVALLALVTWLVGKVFDAAMTFSQAMVIASLSQFPKLLEMILAGAQGALLDPASITTVYSLKFSPARFMGAETSQVMLALAGRLDLFVIWCTILIAIGIAVIGRVEKSKGAIAAATVWLVTGVAVVLLSLTQ